MITLNAASTATATPSANVPLTGSLAALADLGAEIQARWDEHGLAPESFPAVAAACLAASRYHQQFDENEVIRWVSRAVGLPPQLDLAARFGQPPLTVWRGRGFLLDLYFWVDTETAIHDHSFSGAFMNLCGDSLQARYTFADARLLADGLWRGNLAVAGVEHLRPGEAQPIVAGPDFIHAIWHLDCPTITLIARTVEQPHPQNLLTYLPPGLAFEYEMNPPPAHQRRVQFLAYLAERGHPARSQLTEDMLTHATPWEAVIYLSQLLACRRSWGRPQLLDDEVLVRLRSRPEDWWQTVLDALDCADPVRYVAWRKLTKPAHRWLAALLCTYQTPEPLAEWILRRAPGAPWRVTVAQWLLEMMRDGALHIVLGSVQDEIVPCLVQGFSDAAILRTLRQRYTIPRRDEQILRRAFAEFRRNPLFRALKM